jgi:hypothetical protein
MQESMILDEVEIVDRTQQEIASVAALLAESAPDADPGARQIRAAALIARSRIMGIAVEDAIAIEHKLATADAWLATVETGDAIVERSENFAPVKNAPPLPVDARVTRAKAEAEALRKEIETLTARLRRLEDAIAAASPK